MRKTRSDSAHADQLALQSLQIEPPKFCKLSAREKPFFQAIVAARRDWTEHDLIQAVNLARCHAQLDKLQRELGREEMIRATEFGDAINQKHRLIEDLYKRSIALSRIIQVHAQATQGDSNHQVKKNSQKQQIAGQMQNAGDPSGLLARPH